MDESVKVWDVAAERAIATLNGHLGGVKALAAIDEGRLASAATDSTVSSARNRM